MHTLLVITHTHLYVMFRGRKRETHDKAKGEARPGLLAGGGREGWQRLARVLAEGIELPEGSTTPQSKRRRISEVGATTKGGACAHGVCVAWLKVGSALVMAPAKGRRWLGSP